MPETYDIFRKDENGNPIWVEAVETLPILKKRLMKLSSLKPGTHMVYDSDTHQFIEPFKKTA